MPDVIVVDDEPLARQGLRQLLAAHADLRLVGEAGSVADALSLIAKTKPDVVFLDVEMADSSGFDLLRQLDRPPAVIFVSAHAAHAVEAFSVKAIDYLLKPVRPERLAAALARLPLSPQVRAAPERRDAAILQFKTGTRIVSARLTAIVALRAEGDYASVMLAGEPPLLVGRSLGELDADLPHPPFVRLGRSLVINRERLREVRHFGRNRTQLSFDGYPETIAIGRAATNLVRRLVRDVPNGLGDTAPDASPRLDQG